MAVMDAGQKPSREWLKLLRTAGMKTHLIGGAGEFAAKQSKDQGTGLAAGLHQSERPAGVMPAQRLWRAPHPHPLHCVTSVT